MKCNKWISLSFALALMFTLFTGCGNSQSADDNSPSDNAASTSETTSSEDENQEEPVLETIKIGHIVDLTGTQAMTGEEAERALAFAVEALGGTFGGHPVEIVVGDAQDSASVAVDVARKMVEEDGVIAIFGPTQPGHKSAVAEYMQEVGIPLIFYNASPTSLLDGYDWVVGAGGATPQLPSVMADYCYNELGYRKVHILTMDNSGFQMFTDVFIEYFTGLGGEIISEQYAPLDSPDWSLYLSALAGEDADAIVAWASGSNAISLWTAWYESGLSETLPIVAAHHGGFTDYFVPLAISYSVSEAAEAMLGALAPMLYTYDIDTPENQAFVELWEAEYGSVPSNNLPGSCYQAALLLKTAIEDIDGETDPNLLIEAIFNADVTGPEGHLYFEDSHAATKDVYITEVVQIEDGSYNNSIVTVYEAVSPNGLGG